MPEQQTQPLTSIESPAALAQLVSKGRWELADHLALLNQALVYLDLREAPVAFVRDKLGYQIEGADDEVVTFNRLVVEMPPRHGKSELISRYLPAWYLGRHPTEHVILCSYEANFAAVWGGRVRDLLQEWGQLFGVRIKQDKRARFDWEIADHDGGMVTAGVGGPITGRGGNLAIIDDAIKNAEEAASVTVQQRNADWFDSTFYTRLEPDAVVVDMGTRWHVKDMTGHILENQEADPDDEERQDLLGNPDGDEEFWWRIKLPAIAEPGDQLGRPVGQALWSKRFPIERLNRIARRLGSYFFGALYQQTPTSQEGSIFRREWWNRYDRHDPQVQSLISVAAAGYIIVDTAGYDDKTTGDYAAFSVVVKLGKDLYWRYANRGHWTFPQLQQRLRDARSEYGYPILIEWTNWASPLIQSMAAEMEGVVPFKIEGHSKENRARAASPYAEAGNFYLPRDAAWVGPFINEHADFPTGAHDDWVDTTSMAALRLLVGLGSIEYTPPRTRRLTYAPPTETQQRRRPGQLPPPPGTPPGGNRIIGGRA